ncbi:MAG: DUF2306 domain-containing protein [Bacteroidota bacterium]
MRKQLTFGFFLIGAMSMLIMSWHYLLPPDSGILIGKQIAQFDWYKLMFRIHVLCGIIAIFSGPFQLYPFFLRTYSRAHKPVGYLYAVSVLLSGLAGFGVAPFAMGGWISGLGFSTLACLWIFSLIRGIIAARTKELIQHKMWMFLNYGFTFSAITLRTFLLIPLLTDVPFIPVYRFAAWFSWIINGAMAYYFFRKTTQIVST